MRPGIGELTLALGLLAAAIGVWTPSVVIAARPSLSIAGAKAFDMARAADDGAVAASEEAERALTQIKTLTASGRDVEALKARQLEAEAAHQALVGYRKQAQASASEALGLLADATRVAAAEKPDPIRRETLEQRALLAAHEAAVMAARARTEAERLRAVFAEARMIIAGGGRPEPGGSAVPSATAPASGRDVLVPNLVGARLEAAVRDLEAAGLRLGGTTGPREGFVVKQVPEAGVRVPRQATVSVTLSATAAGTSSP